MSWYRVIKLAASPKNIINNWKVDDPFLKFFIYTYEPIIDLSKIKNKEDLNAFITSELLPGLKSKIDRDEKNPFGKPDSNYKKTLTDKEVLDELDAHPDDPQVQQAKEIFLANPKAGKEVLLNAINNDKQLCFDDWWGHMSQNYSDSPAFIYSMLNPIIDSSPDTQKAGPPPTHGKAVAQINDEIQNKGVTQMNVFKKIKKLSFKLDKGEESDSKEDWIRVDSKLKDPKNYKENLSKLMRFATGSGWCIAQNSMANQYLSKGDFWLYFQNSKPKVAIRLEGDKRVAEIRGLHNKPEKLNPYWEPVVKFLSKTDFDYQNNTQYKELSKVMIANADLKNDPEAYRTLMDAIKNDPKQYGLVSEENKTNFPELGKTAAIGYDKRMNELLDAVENIPTTGNEYQNRFTKFQDEYNDIPEEVKPHMSSNIQGRLVNVHKAAFMRNPLEYEFFPDDMKAAITPEDHKEAWTNYVGQDPYRYNDLRIPMEVRKHIPLRPIVEGWDRLVSQNIDHADNIPPFILKYLPKNYIENKIIADFKRYPANRTSRGYDKLDRVKERDLLDDAQILAVYTDFVNRNANNREMENPINLVPPQYRKAIMQDVIPQQGEEGDASPIVDRYFKRILADPTYFASIPHANIRNILVTDPRYVPGVRDSFVKLQQRYRDNWNGYWIDIPEEIKPILPDQIKDSVANFWLPYVQNNRSYLDRLDNIIKPLVENKLQTLPPPQASSNWYKRIRAYELV